MFFLYGTITTSILSFFTYKLLKYLFFPKLKSFDNDFKDEDEYTLFCHRIKYEDGNEDIENDEITREDLEVMNEKNKIKHVIIDYMYNNKFMRYITYDMNIDFPIYDVDVNLSGNREYVDTILLNDVDITSYVKPFLGPKENFYKDKNVKIKLQDLLEEHPDFEVFHFELGKLEIIAESGKKINYELPWTPVWKPFSGYIDNSTDITEFINHNKIDSKFDFTIIPDSLFN